MEKGAKALSSGAAQQSSAMVSGYRLSWVDRPCSAVFHHLSRIILSSASSGICQKCWQQLIKAKKGFSNMKGIVKEIRLSDFMSMPLCVNLGRIFFLA